jgi:hypothetical protein
VEVVVVVWGSWVVEVVVVVTPAQWLWSCTLAACAQERRITLEAASEVTALLSVSYALGWEEMSARKLVHCLQAGAQAREAAQCAQATHGLSALPRHTHHILDMYLS